MKRSTIAAVVAALAIGTSATLACAQPQGYGPGMMGGYEGYGMGPGMMYGYETGPGMGAYGMYGMGPETMGGYGAYGMGPGMMGGYGAYGTGPGMMRGYGRNGAGALDLSDEQREKITRVQESLSTRHWELMGKMREQQFALRELLASGRADDATIGKAYRTLDALRQQLWTSAADARKQMDAVLTQEQREQLQRRFRP